MFEKILLIVLFFTVMILIGAYYRKKARNVGDFVLGGRKMGPWLTAFAYGTTYFSAVVFVGYAGQFGWNYGISAVWIGIGNALIGSALSWILLGRRTRIMTKHFNSATMPQFFESRYGSKAMKYFSSVAIFVFLIPYSASVYKGLSGLFEMAFGIDFRYCMIGMAVITAVYVVLGGYMATAVNDLIQGIIMLGGICLTVYTVLNKQGGLTEAISKLSQIKDVPQSSLTSLFGPDPIGLLSVVILTSLGTLGLPQMIHKFYAIKDDRAIKTGTVISTLFALVIAGGSYFMGGFGRLFYPDGTSPSSYDNIVPAMLSASLPDLMIGIVLILVLSASMSTLSSLVLSSSSTFVLDFIKTTVNKKMGEKSQVLMIKIFCSVFILLSVVLAINPHAMITTLMSISWGALAGAFLGPFLYGLFWKKTTGSAVWVSFIGALLIVGSNIVFSYTTPIIVGAGAMIFSLIAIPAVSLFTPKLSEKQVEEAFSCYHA